MKKKPINRSNIAQHLLIKQLEIVNKKLSSILDEDNWRFHWTITREQHEEFKQYSLFLVQKIFKVNKSKALDIFSWFYKMFGLRIKN